MEKITKIDAAINDTKLRLDFVKRELMLMSRERDVLQTQLDTLEIIKENKELI